MNETIHIHKPTNYTKLILVVVPGVVFIITLLLYLSLSSYSSHQAADTSDTNVLGTNY